METLQALHLIIQGRVQGVGYRAFTKSQAKQLGINGWVRNRSDGNVEAVISGTEQNVGKMLIELRRGPLAARVTHIIVNECNEAIQQGFKQLETA